MRYKTSVNYNEDMTEKNTLHLKTGHLIKDYCRGRKQGNNWTEVINCKCNTSPVLYTCLGFILEHLSHCCTVFFASFIPLCHLKRSRVKESYKWTSLDEKYPWSGIFWECLPKPFKIYTILNWHKICREFPFRRYVQRNALSVQLE